MDPGTALGVASLGVQVCEGLVQYFASYANCHRDISNTTKAISDLLATLKKAKEVVSKAHEESLEEGLKSCESAILNLPNELEKFKPYPESEGLRKKLKDHARRLYYPFKESTLALLRENVADARDNLGFAINTSQLGRLQVIDDRAKTSLELLKQSEQRSVRNDLRDWLKAPDPSTNQSHASAKRKANTGSWFVLGPDYERWKGHCNSFLWLHGFAGCGKTVLSSTIISSTQKLVDNAPKESAAVAYFYFDFADTAKRNCEGFVRSIVLQLAEQDLSETNPLNTLFQNKKPESPSTRSLLDALQQSMERFENVFVIVDALDECNETDELLSAMNLIRSWKIDALHFLVVSRDTPDLRNGMLPTNDENMSIQRQEVDDDIKTVIDEFLKEDQKMQKWAKHHREIEETLVNGAHGMFRWVHCQLEALKQCLNVKMLRKTLQSLPKTLDETYERMLASIEPEHRQYALRLLRWVCFSSAPLELRVVNHALGVMVNTLPYFDEDEVFEDLGDIVRLCPSLFIIHHRRDPTMIGVDSRVVWIISLAHYSVKEFLVSGRLLNGPLAYFNLDSRTANDTIALCCIGYLRQWRFWDLVEEMECSSSPNRHLMFYAAANWTWHLEQSYPSQQLVEAIRNVMMSPGPFFLNWRDGFPFGYPTIILNEMDIRNAEAVPSPVYWASLLGLDILVKTLLERKDVDINFEFKDVEGFGMKIHNSMESLPRTALEAAVCGRNISTVRTLIENGADPNQITSSRHGSALSLASNYHYPEVVECLIKNGSDVNSQDKNGKTPLHHAVRRGGPFQKDAHFHLVQDLAVEVILILLQAGGRIDNVDEVGETALHSALHSVFRWPIYPVEPVLLLVDKGASLEAKDIYGRAPGDYVALELSTILLPINLDVLYNYLPGSEIMISDPPDYWLAFDSLIGRWAFDRISRCIKILVFTQPVWMSEVIATCTLLISARIGEEVVLTKILDKPSLRRFRKHHYEEALRRASCHTGNTAKACIDMLLQRGADVNARDPKFGTTALHQACAVGNGATVALLKSRGADTQAEDKYGRTPIFRTPIAEAEKKSSLLHVLRSLTFLSRLEMPRIPNENESAQTTLFEAAHAGNEDVTQYLTEFLLPLVR